MISEARLTRVTATSPGVERGVGVLLGADADAVRTVVGLLVEVGRLGDGLALPALLIAARRGTDAAGAVHLLAEGRPLPEDWSDYELRTALEEFADDLRDALRSPDPEGGTVPCAGADAPMAAARAVRTGAARALRMEVVEGPLSARRAAVDSAWVERLATAAGWPLEGGRGERGRSEGEPEGDALDEVVPVTSQRIPLLG